MIYWLLKKYGSLSWKELPGRAALTKLYRVRTLIGHTEASPFDQLKAEEDGIYKIHKSFSRKLHMYT